MRELRQDVDLDFSKLLEAGAETNTPGAGVLRPGGRLGLLTGLIVDRYLDNGRSHDVSIYTPLKMLHLECMVCREGVLTLSWLRFLRLQ